VSRRLRRQWYTGLNSRPNHTWCCCGISSPNDLSRRILDWPPSIHMRARATRPKSQVSAKVHYIIVFKEIGVSLYTVRPLADVCQSLRDIINGEKCLSNLFETVSLMPSFHSPKYLAYKYSWVHRDISWGNITAAPGSAISSIPNR
jgi:hypothetical protein